MIFEVYRIRLKIKRMDRKRLRFEDYEEMSYNAEYDMWGVHGVNVYVDGEYVTEIPWVTEAEIADMDEEEIAKLLSENNINL